MVNIETPIKTDKLSPVTNKKKGNRGVGNESRRKKEKGKDTKV